MIDDVGERRGASVVEIWRVLSEPAWPHAAVDASTVGFGTLRLN